MSLEDRESTDTNPYSPDNFDPRPSDLYPFSVEDKELINTDGNKQRIAVIRTSDRSQFRRCRRAWNWGSHLRENLGGKQNISPFWIGSGLHFALEDFHGYNQYGHPCKALSAYAVATHRYNEGQQLSPNWTEDFELTKGMVSYYADHWLKNREHLSTFIWNGVPQVEVNFRVQIPQETFDPTPFGYDSVIYSGTLDRVTIDEDNILWISEYKTAKQIVTHHFETDSQVSTYCWAASLLYPGYTVGGVIYQQHRKTIPDWPKILASGKLSTDKRQSTDYHFYREAIKNIYQTTEKAPAEIIETLNHFATLENTTYNKWVRRDKIFRNKHQMQAEGEKIILEIGEMLNPDLPLYPNPTRDCTFCTFKGPCVATDSGEDWEEELQIFTKPRDLRYDSWRDHLPSPDELKD